MLPSMTRLTVLDRARLAHYALAGVATILLEVCATCAGERSTGGTVVLLGVYAFMLISTTGFTIAAYLGAGVFAWAAALPPADSWWSLPAALCLLAGFSAVTLAASGPDAAPIPRGVARRWWIRTGIVALATASVAAVAVGLAQLRTSGSFVIVLIALAGLAAVGCWLAVVLGQPRGR